MPPKKKSKVDPDVPSSSKSKDEQKPGSKKTGSEDTNKNKDVKVLQNQTTTEFNNQDFNSSSTTDDGKPWNTKISSWNVDGVRAWAKKGGLEYIEREDPDIFCIQETKCSTVKLPSEVKEFKGYHTYWCQSETEGYAGLGLYSKQKPVTVNYGIGLEEFDKEGRVIIAEYENFYLINVYVPNAGRKLVNLDKRMEWDPEFRRVLKELDSKKPVIICGDMNVAHQEIDIANPKTNKRNAGFTQEERDGFTKLLDSNQLIDCFRQKNPEVKGAYTFWTYMANARKKNVGWRLDYFLLSRKIAPSLCDCVIRSDVFGSDHCPVVLLLHV